MERKAEGLRVFLSVKCCQERVLCGAPLGAREMFAFGGTTHCTRVRDQPLLSVLVALDMSFQPGSHFAYLMRMGLRERSSEIPGAKEWGQGTFSRF
jgi:hypothetical protein